MALKSLVYFDDADKDEMPNMFSRLNWEHVKSAISLAYFDFLKAKKD